MDEFELLRDEAILNERKRCQAIIRATQEFGVKPDFVRELIMSGKPLEEVQELMMQGSTNGKR